MRGVTLQEAAPRVAWAVVALVAVLLLCSVWQGPDIFYHLFLGKRVVETLTAQPSDNLIARQSGFVNIYWLFQVVVYALHSLGGVVLASLFFMGVWLGTLAVWARMAGFLASPAVGLPLALGGLVIFQGRFDPRPEALSYLFLALQLRWLTSWSFDRPLGWRRLALFTGSEILWANVHGYFVLGPFLVAGRLGSALLSRSGRGEIRALALLLALVLAGSIASPFGPGTWRCAWILWHFLQEMQGAIGEFNPPTGPFLQLWTVKLFWVYWIGTLAVSVWLVFRKRWKTFYLALVVPAAFLSATSYRNLPLLLLLVAPVWGEALSLVPPARARSWAVGSALVTVAAGLALSYWVPAGGFYHSLRSETFFGIGSPPHAYPVRFAEYLSRHSPAMRIYNNASDGGYLEYRFPEIHPYIDSRYTDPAVVTEYFASHADPAAFLRLHERHRFDGALLKVTDNGRILKELMTRPQWRLVWADLHRVFMVNEESDAGRSLPAERPRYYQEEDLSRRVNGLPAIQWVTLLIQTDRRDMLLDALDAFAAAPEIPSFVIEYAFRHGLERRDPEVLEKGRRMLSRMVALREEDRENVLRLARMAGASAGKE